MVTTGYKYMPKTFITHMSIDVGVVIVYFTFNIQASYKFMGNENQFYNSLLLMSL